MSRLQALAFITWLAIVGVSYTMRDSDRRRAIRIVLGLTVIGLVWADLVDRFVVGR